MPMWRLWATSEKMVCRPLRCAGLRIQWLQCVEGQRNSSSMKTERDTSQPVQMEKSS